MFLTRSGLKRLMERSVKGGGLHVRNDGKGYSICGASWAVYFFKGSIPKETLGDLISLVGYLPGDHEAYTADKGGNQTELYVSEAMTAMDVATDCKELMAKTPVMVEHWPYTLRVFQNVRSGQATVIDEKLVQIIDAELIDSNGGEELPEGPFEGGMLVEDRFTNAICWYNNTMAVSFARYILNGGLTEKIVRVAEQHELYEVLE